MPSRTFSWKYGYPTTIVPTTQLTAVSRGISNFDAATGQLIDGGLVDVLSDEWRRQLRTAAADNVSTWNGTTQSCNEGADFPSDWAVLMGVVVGIVVAILGLIGNAITIGAYRRNRKLRTSFNFLITNLCAVDLVFSAVVIPTHLPMMLTKSDVYDVHWCSAVGYLYYSSLSSSVINLVCIAINRYVGIVHSKRYRYMFAQELAKWWLIGIWVSAPLLYLPLLLVNAIKWRPSSLRCALSSSGYEATSIRCYQITLNIALQVIPTVALAAFYRAILRKVKKCRKTVEHYPITNTPSVATSCMLAGGVVGLTHPVNQNSNQSYCAEKAEEERPKGRGKGRNSPTYRCKAMMGSKENDVTEGKKAIIMAYLQVPSATISPRKNPGSLYRRSPPQTRTMVIPETEGGQSQILISGTTSSPNLTKGKAGRCSPTRWGKQRSFSQGDEEIEPETGMIGDEGSDLQNIEMFSLNLSPFGTCKKTAPKAEHEELQRSSRDECVFSISDDAFELLSSSISNKAEVTSECRSRCTLAMKKSFSSEYEQQKPKQKANYYENGSLLKSFSLPEKEDLRPINALPVKPRPHEWGVDLATIDIRSNETGLHSDGQSSVGSLAKKSRMLTRQRTIDEDADCDHLLTQDAKVKLLKSQEYYLAPISKSQTNHVAESKSCCSLQTYGWNVRMQSGSPSENNDSNFLEKRNASSTPGSTFSLQPTISPQPCHETDSIAPHSGQFLEGDKFEDDKAALVSGRVKRARYVAKAVSSSSDRCYTSQATECTYLPTDNNIQQDDFITPIDSGTTANPDDHPDFPSDPPAQDAESVLSRRMMFRRGASDIGGVRWLKRFRKSRNWSFSSTKQSKYRVRGAAGMRKETIIKIVIENATEDMYESSHQNEIRPRPSQKTKLECITSEISESVSSTDGSAPCKRERAESRHCHKPEQNSATPMTKRGRKGGHCNKCCRTLWNKLIFEYRWMQKTRKSEPPHLSGSNCSNSDADLSDECEWHQKGCEEEPNSQEESSKSNHCDPSMRITSLPNVNKWNCTSPKGNRPIVTLPIPQTSIRKDDCTDLGTTKGRSTPDKTPAKDARADGCESKRNRFASTLQTRDAFPDSSGSQRDSHDGDVISSKENEILLEKRRFINDSSQFLRVSTMAGSENTLGDDASACDLECVDLGRRWSGQSDAISIYSGRYLMSTNAGATVPGSNLSIRGSISAVSQGSHAPTRKQSKKSEGSSGSGVNATHKNRRKSIYQKWFSKKSSIVSSLGSMSSRRRRRDAERRLAYSGLAICIAFAICVLPTSVVGVLLNTTRVDIPANVKFGVAVLSWFHAIINPVLYGFLNPQYRAEYRRMLRDALRWVRCRWGRRTGLGRGAKKSAIIKRMRQQYESDESGRICSKKPCRRICCNT